MDAKAIDANGKNAAQCHTEKDCRLAGLRRFAIAITTLNVLGHFWFGFEQSYAQPLVSLAAAYGTELLLEAIDSWAHHRRPRFLGGVGTFIDFLLSAHITGLAVGMLLYANDRLLVVAFGASAAVASKAVFRAPAGKGTRHYMNPSNFGISIVLLTCPWVGVVPPYHFTENLGDIGTWMLPALIVCSGTLLNGCFTKRLPLIVTWLAAFIAQAGIRTLILGTPFAAGLVPMTGVAFVLFTFYMVTDPATTPSSVRSQIAFAISVALAYTILVYLHIVFDLFFALVLVCMGRGIAMHVAAYRATAAVKAVRAPAIGSDAQLQQQQPTAELVEAGAAA
jgi:hypothetical protein